MNFYFIKNLVRSFVGLTTKKSVSNGRYKADKSITQLLLYVYRTSP